MDSARKLHVRATIFLCAVALTLPASAGTAFAHQPKNPQVDSVTKIDDPEVSKAYYGELAGTPQHYKLKSDRSFVLYLNILAPAIKGAKKDFFVIVTRGAQKDILFQIDGKDSRWVRFYEPFAGDTYWQGPEFKKKVPAGTYLIKVGRPERNRGQYVLAVGEREVFPINELVGTLRAIYEQKTRFFGKNPLSIFQGIIGASLLAVLILIAAGSVWAYRASMRKRRET